MADDCHPALDVKKDYVEPGPVVGQKIFYVNIICGAANSAHVLLC